MNPLPSHQFIDEVAPQTEFHIKSRSSASHFYYAPTANNEQPKQLLYGLHPTPRPPSPLKPMMACLPTELFSLPLLLHKTMIQILSFACKVNTRMKLYWQICSSTRSLFDIERNRHIIRCLSPATVFRPSVRHLSVLSPPSILPRWLLFTVTHSKLTIV